MGRAKSTPDGGALPTPPEWHWTVEEIAVHHRMHPKSIKRAIERGELGARKAGNAYQIPDSFYREWLEGSEVRPLAHS